MKAFLVFVLFFLVLLLFISNSVENLDLTPDTANIAQAPAAMPLATQPVLMSVQQSPILTTTPINSTMVYVPVTGSCANPYTVQPGDWLIKIAAKCSTTLAAILQANPQIIDADLIYPEQLISMPDATSVPVTGGCTNPYTVQPGDWLIKIAANCNTSLAAILQANPQIMDADLIYPDQQISLANVYPSPSATAPIPVTGLNPVVRSETEMQVRVNNFLPNMLVNIAIGPQNGAETVVTSAITDANGNLTTHISVPTVQDSQTAWVVVIESISNPPKRVTSQPFYIQ